MSEPLLSAEIGQANEEGLRWDGTEWIPKEIYEAQIADALNEAKSEEDEVVDAINDFMEGNDDEIF